jgi:hypothetical protein
MPEFYTDWFNKLKSGTDKLFESLPTEELSKNLFWEYLTLTKRNYVNGNIIMNDGRLVAYRMQAPPLLEERADIVVKLNDYLRQRNIPLLFLRAPNPMRDNSDMPAGYENTVYEDGKRFLSILNDNSVATLDLREEMINAFPDFGETFYRGDHHWNTNGALWAYKETAARLIDGFGFEIDERTWDLNEYEQILYKDAFIGSASGQVGFKREDFVVLEPKFPTGYVISKKIRKTFNPIEWQPYDAGSFREVFLYTPQENEKNEYDYSKINLIVDYNIGKRVSTTGRYINELAAEDKSVLLIGDSFGASYSTFLSTAVKQVDYMYLDYFDADNMDLYPLLEESHYDIVLFLASEVTILAEGTNIDKDRFYIGEPPSLE